MNTSDVVDLDVADLGIKVRIIAEAEEAWVAFNACESAIDSAARAALADENLAVGILMASAVRLAAACDKGRATLNDSLKACGYIPGARVACGMVIVQVNEPNLAAILGLLDREPVEDASPEPTDRDEYRDRVTEYNEMIREERC